MRYQEYTQPLESKPRVLGKNAEVGPACETTLLTQDVCDFSVADGRAQNVNCPGIPWGHRVGEWDSAWTLKRTPTLAEAPWLEYFYYFFVKAEYILINITLMSY